MPRTPAIDDRDEEPPSAPASGHALARVLRTLGAWAHLALPLLLLAALTAFWDTRGVGGTLLLSGAFGGVVLAVAAVWKALGAPAGVELVRLARPFLLAPRVRQTLYGLSVLLFAAAICSAEVRIEGTSVVDTVTILRVTSVDDDTVGGSAPVDLVLTRRAPSVSDLVLVPPWGRDVRYRALSGRSTVAVRAVPWSAQVLTHPTDFTPFTLYALVWPWFAGAGRLPVEVSLTSLDGIDLGPLGTVTVDQAPVAVAALGSQPDTPTAADSVRWLAAAQALFPDPENALLAGDWRSSVVWLRTSRPLRASEHLRISVRRADGTVATRDTTLFDRITDVHLTKTPE